MLWFLLTLALFGLIVGAIARLVVPGPTPMGVLGTMAAGVAGALIAGLIGKLLFGPTYAPGWIMSILGAIAVVALVQRGRGGAWGGRWGGFRGRRAYDDEVLVDDPGPAYVPARRRGWFGGGFGTPRRRFF